MNKYLSTLATAAAGGLLSACSTGGGGGGDGTQVLICIMNPLVCGAQVGAPPPPTGPEQFSRWEDHVWDAVEASGPETRMTYQSAADGTITGLSAASSTNGATTTVESDSKGVPVRFTKDGTTIYAESRNQSTFLTLDGHAGLHVSDAPVLPGNSQTPFLVPELPQQGTSYLDNGDLAVVADPYVYGWSYQSFGVWNLQGAGAGTIGASSYGVASPAGAVPASGNATFTGTLAGLYVSPAGEGSIAAAHLAVEVNFSSRSLSLSSTNTTTTRAPGLSSAPTPNLDLSGTLSYVPGSARFSGTLVNAGGTMSGASQGQFYGPAAQELGGVFSLKAATGVETFVGAYGAKP